ncbi:MAG: hypothetical protein ACK2UM_12815 [Anaerolineales bacterium]|jgi:hypothetical protein
MNEETLYRFAGWSAYFNAAIFILSMIALMLFFSIGGIWGRINDSLSIIWMLSYLPLAVALFLMNRDFNAKLSGFASLLGSAAVLTFVILQFLLVIGRVQFEQTFTAVLIMTALVGIFVLIHAFLARGAHNLPPGLTWVMILYGIASVVGAVGFQIGGEQHPLAMIGLLLNAVSGLFWVIWFGRLLMSNAMVADVAAVT